MGGLGVVWRVVKTAATKIPWGRVVENAPLVVDMVGRARARLTALPHHDFEVQLRSIQEENLKLAQTLQQSADHLQEVSQTLLVVEARQKMLVSATVVSLLIAVSALAVALLK
jgi:hypothetical protein